MVFCLWWGADFIWPSWCHCYSLSVAPVNLDWFYLSGTGSWVQVYVYYTRQDKTYKTRQTDTRLMLYCFPLHMTSIITDHWQVPSVQGSDDTSSQVCPQIVSQSPGLYTTNHLSLTGLAEYHTACRLSSVMPTYTPGITDVHDTNVSDERVVNICNEFSDSTELSGRFVCLRRIRNDLSIMLPHVSLCTYFFYYWCMCNV